MHPIMNLLGSTNLLKNEKIIDLGDFKTGPIRPVLIVIIIII